ncbi:hypothetical protein [Frischella perrara]|uniref:hypothetical protein n=1 Tax=Frischella perrara TaxID=1267021 RepID=UPI0023EF6460|nr:hypothetical protein [Frischella perrara]MCT6875591.1 hypothetical protein [Frischella perrara]
MSIYNLTRGQKLVGLTFNDKVTKYKQACADAVDILLKDETKEGIDIEIENRKKTYPKTIEYDAETLINLFIQAISSVNHIDTELSESLYSFECSRFRYIIFDRRMTRGSMMDYDLIITILKDNQDLDNKPGFGKYVSLGKSDKIELYLKY